MNQISLYALRFEPRYQYRLWGGRRLASLLSAPRGGGAPPFMCRHGWLVLYHGVSKSAGGEHLSGDGKLTV